MASVTLAQRYQQGCAFLSEQGLNLIAVFDCTREPVAKMLGSQAVDFSRLLLIGNGGAGFWRVLQANSNDSKNPVDDFSRQIAVRMVEEYLHARSLVLYPGDLNLPLQQLGALIGWHYPSPLGIGNHPKYGLWFAYRAVVLTDAPLVPTVPIMGSSACLSCDNQPCLSACPAQALAQLGQPNIERCLSWRTTPDSSCETTCLARLVCPVGRKHRYDMQQIEYHYGRSLHDLQAEQAIKTQ